MTLSVKQFCPKCQKVWRKYNAERQQVRRIKIKELRPQESGRVKTIKAAGPAELEDLKCKNYGPKTNLLS